MLNDPIVIVGAARTPMGGFGSGRSLRELDFAFAKSACTETAIGELALPEDCDAQ